MTAPTTHQLRALLAAAGTTALLLTATSAIAQPTDQAPAQPTAATSSVWSLFVQSFDLFTIILILGSIAAVAQIVRVAMEARETIIAPPETTERLLDAIRNENAAQLNQTLKEDESFVPAVLSAAIEQQHRGRSAMRESAEIEASLQAAKWFRKIEILNVIGNLGPLVGLAGTVWGMVIAFNTLGQAGGEAGPAQLSSGIAKALFHTLLGLMLAIPCLLSFGIYRSAIDRICNRAMADAAKLLERLPASDDQR